jgi:hypothetical protein
MGGTFASIGQGIRSRYLIFSLIFLCNASGESKLGQVQHAYLQSGWWALIGRFVRKYL